MKTLHCGIIRFRKRKHWRAGKMGQHLKTFNVLAENLSSAPRTTSDDSHTPLTPGLRELMLTTFLTQVTA